MGDIAKWDDTYGRVVSIIEDGDSFEQQKFTGVGEMPDSQTRWLELIYEYPDNYIPEYPELLGPYTIQLSPEGDLLYAKFPQEGYTPENVRAVIKDKIHIDLRRALEDTNFYILNSLETGAIVPEEVLVGRNAAREAAETALSELENLADDLLPDFTWDIPQTRPFFHWNPPSPPPDTRL